MAIIQKSELKPSKLELLTAWLPKQPWFESDGEPALERVNSFWLDDPAGEVGIEVFLVRTAGGPTLHVPMTYRGAPLEGAEDHLIGTMSHSVLGSRWIYDACGDPVFAGELARVILTGGSEAGEFLETEGGLEPIPGSAQVHGSGTPGTAVPAIDAVKAETTGATTTIRGAGLALSVFRVPGTEAPLALSGAQTLTGTWGDDAPTVVFAAASGS